jgi:hypothetical protein
MKRLIFFFALALLPLFAAAQYPQDAGKIRLSQIDAPPSSSGMKGIRIECEFSTLFVTGHLPDHYVGLDDMTIKAAVCADALGAWGCVMAGAAIPPKFCEGMAIVSRWLGIPSNPAELMQYADNLLRN